MKNDEISQPERNYCFPNCLMKIIMTKNAADLEKSGKPTQKLKFTM